MKIYSRDSEAELTSEIYMYQGSNFQSVAWGPWGSQRPFQKAYLAKAIFIITRGCYLHCGLSFSYKYTVAVLRGYMT